MNPLIFAQVIGEANKIIIILLNTRNLWLKLLNYYVDNDISEYKEILFSLIQESP